MPASGATRRVIPIVASAPSPAEMVSLYQSEAKIQPRSVSGWFAGWRWALVWFTQLLFYGLPWLQWGERQAVLFDLAARRFYIFGLVLYPQDFVYLAGLLILSAFALFLFTAVAGRLWCGFACPQTVYTEIFMWVERRFEGDRQARIKLDAAPWGANKLWRRGGKHAVWLAIGLWTGFTFVAYFTPARTLLAGVTTLIGFGGPAARGLGPWEWFWSLFYGFATYGNAGYMREQVCKYMCPYARFQSAMFDRDTLIVSYDAARGDPRGTRARGADLKAAKLGDCIDCGLCVHVCPVGIDIRNGLQYECIACSACIDACDGVMDKMNYPRGLIRYATQNGLDERLSSRQMWARVARPRVLVYDAVLIAISLAFVVSLSMRDRFKVDVVRDRMTLARQVEDGQVENLYRLQLMNATEHAQTYRIAVRGIEAASIVDAQPVTVLPAEARWVTLAVRVAPQTAHRLGAGAHPIAFEVSAADDPTARVSERSTFVVPR